MDDFEKTKKEKKSLKQKFSRLNIEQSYEKVQTNIPFLFWTCFCAVILMVLVGCAVFFTTIKGAEKVPVPNVIGKELEDAIMDLQVWKLNVNINLRFSDDGTPKGIVMEQSPKANAIVKGNSIVTLVVSRGSENDEVKNVVGTLFNNLESTENILVSEPEYINSSEPAGTILAQYPRPGYKIGSPVKLLTVVSSGSEKEKTSMPDLDGISINELLELIKTSNVVFDISGSFANIDDTNGKVISQSVKASSQIDKFSRVDVELAMPENTEDNIVLGIFQEKLAEYPFPVPMKIVARNAGGEESELISFNHPGGNVSIPYAVSKGTTLFLSVNDSIVSKVLVG